PTNLDVVCVQKTHLEARGKMTKESSFSSFNQKNKQSEGKGSKEKGKGKGKHKINSTVKKEDEKPFCNHCKKNHDESKCWKLHLENKPKWMVKKGKEKKTNTVVHDLGSDSGDETKITAMSFQGKSTLSISNNSTTDVASSYNKQTIPDDKKRNELFHIR
ncbi:hypothetical protein KI387_020612, partial [Taxus chinensis]